MFSAADTNGDRLLNLTEADALRVSVRDALMAHRCLLIGHDVCMPHRCRTFGSDSCYAMHVGSDGVLSESELTAGFVPCLLTGLSPRCRAVICPEE